MAKLTRELQEVYNQLPPDRVAALQDKLYKLANKGADKLLDAPGVPGEVAIEAALNIARVLNTLEDADKKRTDNREGEMRILKMTSDLGATDQGPAIHITINSGDKKSSK